jgi:hypothetical protein
MMRRIVVGACQPNRYVVLTYLLSGLLINMFLYQALSAGLYPGGPQKYGFEDCDLPSTNASPCLRLAVNNFNTTPQPPTV